MKLQETNFLPCLRKGKHRLHVGSWMPFMGLGCLACVVLSCGCILLC
jgi:hypothetical protein